MVRSYNECYAMPIARVAYTNDDGWIISAGIGVKIVQRVYVVSNIIYIYIHISARIHGNHYDPCAVCVFALFVFKTMRIFNF